MTVTRKEIEALFIRHIQTFMPPGQVEDARRLFGMLTDDEFLALCLEALRANGITPPTQSAEEVFAGILLMAVAAGSPPLQGVQAMLQKDAKPYWRVIDRTKPPCTVSLLRCEDIELTALWKTDSSSQTIPSDIILAGNAPAPDMTLEIDESALEDGEVFRFRVLLFPDYREQILAAGDSAEATVGAVVVTLEPGTEFFIPFGVQQGVQNILLRPIGCRSAAMAADLRKDPRFNLAMLHKLGTAILETWYGIQYKLLHPADDYLYLYLLESTCPEAADKLYG